MTDEAKQKLVDDAQAKVDRLTQELSLAAGELEVAKAEVKAPVAKPTTKTDHNTTEPKKK